MNAVEIEEAVSILAEQPFDAAEFPYAFLLAFGEKDTSIKRLRAGATNKSDLGGLLQANRIHIKTCAEGEATATLTALRESPATTKSKAKFILATDGVELHAEDLTSGEAVITPYAAFPNHFGFFLPLAGITTVKAIRESAFDIKATGRLNRLYIELLKDNPDWGTAARRHEMNQLMARLIFCFFAEDTGIFPGETVFTRTVETMSARDSSNTHEVIGQLFRAMNTKVADRAAAGIPRWADPLPYVNGGLFSGSSDAPRFSKIARSYLLAIGGLDWTKINPDIFGSMIQAVADDEERGALGMHYTSVPNILKVLNPLFLNDLRSVLDEAGDNGRKLLNLRNRMAKIRVFDPACGSGNFLVIAYKELRALEAEINRRRGESDRRSEINLTNFRGIELRDFPATIARLALIIAEYQCDVLYRGQLEATRAFLPLDSQNWITCGNSLRLDWLSVCPPTGTGVKMQGDDLFGTPLNQAEIDFESASGETFICGNPPFSGSVQQSPSQKIDMAKIFAHRLKSYKDLDYVAAFIMKAADYNKTARSTAAFVSTNSICQGEQVAMLWRLVFETSNIITFAYNSFLWKNLAANNAGVTCAIVGISTDQTQTRTIFGNGSARKVHSISPYLTSGDAVIVQKSTNPISQLPKMVKGNQPNDGGNLILSQSDVEMLKRENAAGMHLVRRFVGSRDFIQGTTRWCLWIGDDQTSLANKIEFISHRVRGVENFRKNSSGSQSQQHADTPHRFVYAPHRETWALVMPRVFSERREYITVGLIDGRSSVVSDTATALYDADLPSFSLISSRMHMIWIATVCGKLKTDLRYSNTLGWNTFPVPDLTEKQKSDLTHCAEDILLAREAHFPATIAELYDPEKMPGDLRAAHDRNDETLERIYIGRRFRNDTERLEHLFALYTKMTTKPKARA